MSEFALDVVRFPAAERAPLPLISYQENAPTLRHTWLLKGLLLSGSTTIVFGAPGAGKSFLVLDIALSIASGLPWFDRKVSPGAVLYIAAEGASGCQKRVAAWQAENPHVCNIPFAIVPRALDLLRGGQDMQDLVTTLQFFIREHGALNLLIVDTLAATFGDGDENGSDMAVYVRQLGELGRRFNCAVLIVHHQPLTNEARPRGHGSLAASADTILHVKELTGGRRIQAIKQKDAELPPQIWFALREVVIGSDEDGEKVVSAVLRPLTAASAKASRGPKMAKEDIEALSVLRGLLEGSNGVTRRQWQEGYAARRSDIMPDSIRTAFARARKRLERYGYVHCGDHYTSVNEPDMSGHNIG